MKALILTAPYKTTEELNWAKPLNSYLLSVYGNTTDFQDDLAKFTDLRKNIQDATSGSENAANVETFLNYYSKLELVDLRVPMAIVNKRKPVKFTWTDAFSPSAEHTQSALAFEKASILFNLGAALMKEAAHTYSESFKSGAENGDSLFKDAIQQMQQAAGVFSYLSESFIHGPSPDLSPPTVKFLMNLCLAQSQEIFALKVIDGDLEQKKNSLISKLCASAAKYYEDSYKETAHLVSEDGSSYVDEPAEFGIEEAGSEDEFLGEDSDFDPNESGPGSSNASTSKVSARMNPSWVATFRVKHLYYESLAYYFQGLQLEAGKKFGESIACLSKSSEFFGQISTMLLKSVAKSRGFHVYDLLDNLEYQKDALKIKLADLTKDNDLIYHDIIPSLVTLAAPKPMNSAKIILLNKIPAFIAINENNYNNFLHNVVPVSIHELLSYYSEEKSQLLRNEIDAADVSNEELASALEYLNLPKALVSVKELILAEKPLEYGSTESSLDHESLTKVQEISSIFSQDNANRNSIAQSRKSIHESLMKSESLLNSASFSSIGDKFRDDVIKLKKSLYDAANSDARLFSLIDQDNSALYRILGKGASSPEFKHHFEMVGTTQSVKSDPEIEVSLLDMDDNQLEKMSVTIEDKIRRLEDLLNDLNNLKSGKAKVIAELKKAIHEDDISDILLINSRVKLTSEIKTLIFPEELKKFDAFVNSLSKLVDQQKAILSDTRRLWEELSSSPKVQSVQSSSTFRSGLIAEHKSKIENFYNNIWKKYSAGLRKGAEFYIKLLEYTKSLEGTISGQLQKSSLNHSMDSLKLSSDLTGGSAYSQVSQSSGMPVQTTAQPGWPTNVNWGQNQKVYQGAATNGSRDMLTSMGSGAPNGPQLPPKRPSQNSILGSFGASVQQDTIKSAQRSKPTASFGSGFRKDGSKEGSELIYDQPSMYEPNMYDFFTQQRE
ncbi:hypothetical protein OXX59_004859 [Metschnikowia pulcherrima]